MSCSGHDPAAGKNAVSNNIRWAHYDLVWLHRNPNNDISAMVEEKTQPTVQGCLTTAPWFIHKEKAVKSVTCSVDSLIVGTLYPESLLINVL